jgi:tripartite-type tricarboxylate transporter receptor subunit TctC
MNFSGIFAAAGIGLLSLVSTPALAQYPDRPVTVIIPFAPGGGADITARTIFPFVAKHMPNGATFVMVNRAGGGGEVGFTEIALSEPDGYTLGAINTPSVVMKPIEKETRYTREDFTYVANLAFDPSGVAVRADSNIQTFKQLIEELKANPGSIVAGTAGVGSEDHLLLSRLMALAGVEIRLAPFGSSGEALVALKGGHVAISVVNSAVSAAEAGNIRVLALASDKRWDHLPDVPTFQELGIDLIGGSARGYGGPAGMPDDVTKMLSDAFAAAVADPEFLAVAAEQKLPLRYMDAEAYRTFVEEQHEAIAKQWDVNPWIE